MKKIFLSLLVVFMVLSLSVVLVKAEGETSVALTDGVQIRTDGNNGLRWEAKVENAQEGQVYGFLFAQGELTAEQLNKDTVNVVAQEVEGLKEDGTYHATMINFPKSAAVQDITVRAYVKTGEVYTYSENVVTRNLSEVAVEAKNSIDGEFVDAIAENVFANYVKQYKIGDVIYINDSLYEYEPLALAEIFIKDWNKVLDEKVTSMDGFGAKYIGAYADAGTYDAVTSNKVYQFFNANEGEMLAKWGWLLNYLSDTAGNSYVTSQVKLINGKTSLADSNSGWWGARHLLSRIQGFFTRANATGTGFNCSTYATDSELPGLVEVLKGLEDKFYTVVDSKFIKVGEDYTFPSQEVVNGYSSSWVSGSNLYENESKYTVSIDTFATFTSEYTPITYGVKFFDGETELTTLAKDYTIESSTLTLPEYVKEGYQFLGWYDNASFEGDPIASIASGSYGEKVYYAKTIESSNVEVDVQFDANGGLLTVNTLSIDKYVNNAEFDITLSDKNVTSWSGLQYYNKVVLMYNEVLGLYEVVALDTATVKLSAIGVEWSHVIWSGSSVIFENIEIGSYVGLSSASGVVVGAVDLTASVYAENYTQKLKDPIELPEASRTGYIFKGWKSSIDDQVVTEYPGYLTNPGIITYTAQYEKAEAYNATKAVGYSSLDTAIAEAASGDTVIVYPGKYTQNITLDKPIKLTTPNSAINPVTNPDSFINENAVILTGVFSFNGLCDNSVVSGFTFTEGARVFFYGANETAHDITNFKFTNNYCHDTTYTASSWNVSSSTGYSNNTSSRIGFMNLCGVYRFFNNSEISNNVFKNINDSAIQIVYCQNLNIIGNKFEGIKYDAVRLMDSYGTTNIDGNIFKDVTYAALFFRTYCGSYRMASTWNVVNNTFENVATYTTSPTSDFVVGAICSRGYGESYSATWNINYNTFLNTPHCINLRDNVTNSATWATGSKVWECKVTYNAFINAETPAKYQENWKLSADSAATNTGNFLFDYNYYGTSKEVAIEIQSSQFTQILSTSHANNFSTYTAYEEAVLAKKAE